MNKYPLIGKCLAVGIILLFIGTSILPSSGQTIDKLSLPLSRGNTLYVGGSGPGNYSRIQDAIDNATNGDTVFVYDDSAPYSEHIFIYRAIKLIGENKETTVINNINSSYTVEITSTPVSISSFTINANYHSQNYSRVYRSLNVLTNNNIISNNIFQNAWMGISVKAKNNVIENNLFRQLRSGIELVSSNHNTISNNTLSNPGGAGDGILINNGDRNTIENNNIAGFFNCIEAMNYCLFNKIINNTLNCTASRFGINMNWLLTNQSYIISATNFEIAENVISNASDGAAIYIHGGMHNIHHNIITRCYWGIRLEGGSTFIHHNTFLDNQGDVTFRLYLLNAVTTFFFRNYWNETLLHPKPISGQIGLFRFYPLYFHSWIKYDWFPAQEPNNIPGMR